jgi:hypothetical protein
MRSVLAGNPGPATSPGTVILLLVVLLLAVVGVFGVAALAGFSWRRSQADARTEAYAQHITASWPVGMRTEGYFVFHGPGTKAGRVSLRGGFIEVAHTWSVSRTLNKGEFYFPARETQLWVEAGAFGRERLVISGPSGGQAALVSVSPGSRAALVQMWKALAEAGATLGSPYAR